MKPCGEGGLIQSSITLLGVIYQPILKEKVTRQTLEIDVFEELQVQCIDSFQQRIIFST